MTTSSSPLAFFITWTVYGTHLQGHQRGWRKWSKGEQLPMPDLEKWRSERLKYPILLLSKEQRQTVENYARKHCDHRDWRLWEVNARSNHVHAVVTAPGYTAMKVRDQLKANCTVGLRKLWSVFHDRTVWTVGGDCECINDENDLDLVCTYVRDSQDRKERDHY